ncbi:MAG: AsmA family protein, partial [Candidatus Methylomirabilales bacterium]
MKRLAMIGVVILVLIVGGVVFLYLSLNRVIRSAVETYGPQVTKSEIRLGGVSVSPLSGKAELSNLVVGNPKGFKTPSAFTLGAMRVSLEVGSVMSDTIAIHEILISGPEVTYELGPGGSNIAVLQKNVGEFSGGGTSGAASPQAQGSQKKVTIDRLRIEKAKLKVSALALKGEAITLPLPNIEMKDI